MKNSIHSVERLYNVAYRSIFTVNGRLSYDRVTDCLIKLADMLVETETDEFTFQEIGEHSEADLGALIIGAFWHYTEYHKGQDSKGYAALSSLGRIFSPGMEQGPEPDSSEYDAYRMLAELANGGDNTMEVETINFTVPAWTLSYLINGDMSGYSDEEEKAVIQFESNCINEAKKMGASNWHFSTVENSEPEFAYSNDVTGSEGGTVEQINFVMLQPGRGE
ncbi:hypothetical protein [Marinobacter nauticus]|uniref:Uncharacterized protein n=1 Tax=Marinobacter nauticus TaxID=2743 RepID=A0A833JQG0_MARNT|nr:hypothetical protein [Marinobacter nauticus]KAE8546182.1 hypothetical protein F6453_1428 [Marinobacter nauticus]